MAKTLTVLGLMSGTSMDGIDASLLRTDGVQAGEALAHSFTPYPDDVREAIRAVTGNIPGDDAANAAKLVTDWHIQAVRNFPHDGPIDLIGFHGQTVFHDPANARTYQLGDGERLAAETGIPAIYDFRSADMRAGGQGAPLLPLYHKALTVRSGLDQPVCVLNLGGVANITWISGEQVIACDTGPASALIDDWMLRKTGTAMDKDGASALRGLPDLARVTEWLQRAYFAKPAPKSLDRDAFSACSVDDLPVDDGAATLTTFTVNSILMGLAQMPERTRHVIACGGGRHNRAIMRGLSARVAVTDADQLGWSGDYIEAEGFAYLAARSLGGLPLSLPTTTGCASPVTGGRLARPKTQAA